MSIKQRTEAGPAAYAHRKETFVPRQGWAFRPGALVAPLQRTGRWLLVLFFIFCSGLAVAAEAPFRVRDEGWQGLSALWRLARAELGEQRVIATGRLDYSSLSPADGILFLHPEQRIRFSALADFLSAGGRAAVVDDFAHGEALWTRFHIHKSTPPAKPLYTVGGRSALAVAVPASLLPDDESAFEHTTLEGVSEVVTNHPVGLRLRNDVELTPLLRIPGATGEDALLAVTGVIGDAEGCGLVEGARTRTQARCGRLVAMGDPSVFINLMLRYRGNAQFARGLVRYLTEDDSWGRRGGVLYVVSGRFEQRGSFQSNDSLAGQLQDLRSDLTDAFYELRSQGLPEPVGIGLSAAIVLAICAWLIFVVSRKVMAAVPSYAQAAPLVSQGGVAGAIAALARDGADRALVAAELKRSAEASLRHELGLSEQASRDAIADSLTRTGRLSAARAEELTAVLKGLGAGEDALLSATRLRMSQRRLTQLHRQLLDLLSTMKDPPPSRS